MNRRVLCAFASGLALLICTIPRLPATGHTDRSANQSVATNTAFTHDGIVVIQFDDGRSSHYDIALPTLARFGITGTFGIVTGALDQPGVLTRNQVVEIASAGHEVHDHTLHHNADFWGDTLNAPLWPGRIDSSLAIFADMGLATRGWNQPGGTGQGWSQQLRDCLAGYYDYAAGRVGLDWSRAKNFHWHLRDDPLGLGRGGVVSWGWNAASGGQPCEDPAEEFRAMWRRMVDGYAQGLVVVPLFHLITESDSTAWALARICSLVAASGLSNMRLEDALHRVQNAHQYVSPHAEQIPNPEFTRDLDGDNRPDGWYDCSYASTAECAPVAGSRASSRVVELTWGTRTEIYGPELGPTRFRFYARSSVPSQKISISIVFTKVNEEYEYQDETIWLPRTALTEEWQSYNFTVDVPDHTDHLIISLGGFNSPVYISEATWRLETAVPALSTAGLAVIAAVMFAVSAAVMRRKDKLHRRPAT